MIFCFLFFLFFEKYYLDILITKHIFILENSNKQQVESQNQRQSTSQRWRSEFGTSLQPRLQEDVCARASV